MAIGLYVLTITASVCQHQVPAFFIMNELVANGPQFFWRSMSTGVLARAALISSVYRRGVSLTPKARTTLNNASLVNFISTDVSRVDQCAQWFVSIASVPFS